MDKSLSPCQSLVNIFTVSSLKTPEQDLLARLDQDQEPAPSIVYPKQVSAQAIAQPLRKLLEKAKENIDVIDFTKHFTVSSRNFLSK